MTVDKKIFDRIEKLLKMAQDSSSPNEAAIAATRAAKLMEKHQLENKDFILDDIRINGATEQDYKTGKKNIPLHVNGLAISTAKLYDCEVRKTSTGDLKFFGYKEDITVCIQTLNFLIDIIETLAERDFKEAKDNGVQTHGRSWKSSYRKGASLSICDTLKRMKFEQQKASTEKGLVVLKSQSIQERFGNFQYGRRKATTSDSGAYYKGTVEGAKVKIRKQISN